MERLAERLPTRMLCAATRDLRIHLVRLQRDVDVAWTELFRTIRDSHFWNALTCQKDAFFCSVLASETVHLHRKFIRLIAVLPIHPYSDRPRLHGSDHNPTSPTSHSTSQTAFSIASSILSCLANVSASDSEMGMEPAKSLVVANFTSRTSAADDFLDSDRTCPLSFACESPASLVPADSCSVLTCSFDSLGTVAGSVVRLNKAFMASPPGSTSVSIDPSQSSGRPGSTQSLSFFSALSSPGHLAGRSDHGQSPVPRFGDLIPFIELNDVHLDAEVYNFSKLRLSAKQISALNGSLKFRQSPQVLPYLQLIAGVEDAARMMEAKEMEGAVLFRASCAEAIQTASKPPPNVESTEFKVLLNLAKNEEITITQADKGGRICVLDSNQYTEMCISHLQDDAYERIHVFGHARGRVDLREMDLFNESF